MTHFNLMRNTILQQTLDELQQVLTSFEVDDIKSLLTMFFDSFRLVLNKILMKIVDGRWELSESNVILSKVSFW